MISDPDGNPLGNPTILNNTNNGTTTIDANGNIIYNPSLGYSGNDTLTYVICDLGTPSKCDTAQVIITVIPVNHAPITSDINTTVASGTTVPLNIAAGTSDPDGDLLTYTYGAPTGMPATVTVTGNGTITVHPINSNDTGMVTIHFIVCDNGIPSLCDSGIITIHFIPDSILAITPLPPVATIDNTSTNPGTPVIINVKGNDSDPNGNSTLGLPTIIANPKNGTASIDSAGNITYLPNTGFTGNDTLTYYICDNGIPTKCDTALVIISVTTLPTPNHPPVATDDYRTTSQNTSISIDVKSNDSDPDGNVLGLPSVIVNPSHGTVTVDVNGNVIYTPNANYFGGDTLSYIICDLGTPSKCDTAVVFITIKQSIFPIVIANNDEAITNNFYKCYYSNIK